MPRTARASIDALESRRLLADVSFVIDRKVSQLDISAEVDVDHVGDFNLHPQADGLDTAPITGSLVASITKGGVRFYSGSSIELVDDSGEYSPGDAPANLALDGRVKKLGITLAEVDAAFRDVTFDLSNPSRGKVDNKTKRFDLRNATAEVTDGRVDYDLDSKFGDDDGSKSLEGLRSKISNTRGKLTGTAGSRAITVPIHVEYERDVGDATVTFTLTGSIVGREVGGAATQAVATTSAVKRASRVADDVFANATIV